MDCLDEDPNPNPNHFVEKYIVDPPPMDFDELSNYLMLDGYDFSRDNQDSSSSQSVGSSSQNFAGGAGSGGSSGGAASRNNMNVEVRRNKLNKVEGDNHRVAFRTKSELEVMDDGFKWRKYGKKSVKNSPNPRNYYKCSNGGCNVKKRVERDRDDASYVITTYEGVHTHESPSVVYYNQMHADPNNIWTLRASSQSSASS
ncbi:WRKY transcription factor 51 [Pyrus ussuriensis x Pyrus communis]|uniref:WRKY transcription factor 51 n=1 Tax=Pyrus ussuriensis x Pyrus communis TaxID=2448454 RepID=A0A5N5GP42_9ROSA|nr:WRKY transcription factor 51 [Pyrus ussuriensis x Pyrus communis]